MRLFSVAGCVLALSASVASAATITGEYVEARSCDVYTGPCFANAQMNAAGKEALMAWKVDQGTWNGVSLDGLGVALVVNAEGTLGDTGVFKLSSGKTKSVILVDEKASDAQLDALVAFVRDTAKDLSGDVTQIDRVPFSLKNDHVTGKGVFKAGKVASIETRGLKKGDCICTNEIVYYKPLTKVENSHPAFATQWAFQGNGLGNKWSVNGQRSAFLATFRR
ncbi:MAG: DUF1326 domain-containing protein [Planctomycetaceae bacterium]|nr:DUF1326 domain-containing protein [Planctomycetaceae bacterium]